MDGRRTGSARARYSFSGAMAAALLGCLSFAITLAFWYGASSARWLWAQVAVSAFLYAILWSRRHAPTVWLGSTAFLLNAGTILVTVTVVGRDLARHGYPQAAPDAWRLGTIATALLAPPVMWVAILPVLAYFVAMLLWAVAYPGSALENFWMTVLYALFVIGLLLFRQRALAIQQAAVRSRMEAMALERFAREFLALRDLANTPLQTLENLKTLLRAGHPDTLPLVERMDRALARLKQLSQVLGAYEFDIRWKTEEESFDPMKILTRKGWNGTGGHPSRRR